MIRSHQIYNELISIMCVCVSPIFSIGFGELTGVLAFKGPATANNLDDKNNSALLYAAENGNKFSGKSVASFFPQFLHSLLKDTYCELRVHICRKLIRRI